MGLERQGGPSSEGPFNKDAPKISLMQRRYIPILPSYSERPLRENEYPDLQQEIRADNKFFKTLKDERGRTTADTAKKLGTATLIIGGAGVSTIAGMQATNVIDIESFPNIFNSSQDIEGLLPHLQQPDKSEVFDNEATESEVGQNNMYFVDKEDLSKFDFKPVIDKRKNTIAFILPVMVSENTTGIIKRISLTKNIPVGVDPKELPPIIPIIFQFNKIVSIFAPDDSYINLIRGAQEVGQDPNLASSIRFYKYYEDQDVTVLWWFYGYGKEALTPLLPVRDFNKEDGRGTNYEKLPAVSQLTKSARTIRPNQEFQLTLKAYKGKVVGPEAELAHQDFLLEPQFITLNETGRLIAVRYKE